MGKLEEMMDREKSKTEQPPPVDAPVLRIPVPRGPIPLPPPQVAKKTVELRIDGQQLSVPEGTTLLEAARSVGIDTPTLCYLENLTPVNVCRICVVELEGSRTLVPACSRKAEPGMVVSTDSERVRLSRRLVLELLSSSVDVSTAPQLQSYMKRYAAEPERFGCPASVAPRAEQPAGSLAVHVATVNQPVKIDNELYVRDYGKCILCYKCVEACGKDAQNTFAIAVA
ncbi:MAG TPA: 2Fe-2S iron-sulfur cluster-binding protein, partial [Terriglobia bacterium]|nr:2Fe-2S iron-sulfur cluster-binding protein [Terriglobia bacterium]